MRRRRRSRNYRFSQQRKAKYSLMPVALMLCLSVGCGYAAAKYVVEPVVNYVPQLTADKIQKLTEDTPEDKTAEDADSSAAEKKDAVEKTVVEDEADVKETEKIAGYALQFGCYSGKEAAETAMGSIGMTGLQVLEQDGMFKIIGETYDTKEKAAAALKELPDTVNAFVTTIYK